MLTFDKRIFYTLSDIVAYVQDFPIDQSCDYVYEHVVKQVETIFELESAFIFGLRRDIKKNKSWALVFWNEFEVDQLLAPLLCHVRANCIGGKRQEGALKTINQH